MASIRTSSPAGMGRSPTLRAVQPLPRYSTRIDLPGASELPEAVDEANELVLFLRNEPEQARKEKKAAWLAYTIYRRVTEKLQREPVEDFRIDFEDGYGNRPDDEEDGHAVSG